MEGKLGFFLKWQVTFYKGKTLASGNAANGKPILNDIFWLPFFKLYF